MQSYILGVDIGTGSTKAVAVNFSGVALEGSQHYYPVKAPKPGYSEQDPEVILTAFVSCITEVIKRIGYAPVAISLSSAMHSVIAVDKAGNALSDMITWADARSEEIAGDLRNSAQGPAIYLASGTPIHAMTPLCKIMWLRKNEPLLFSNTYKFISIKEYIWHYLFGVFEVDYAIASATGLFNINTLQWNSAALILAGITENNLSEPVNTTHQRAGLSGKAAEDLKLPPETCFVTGASDGCCANLGSFVTTPDTASLTIGTSGAVRITSPRAIPDFEAMIFNYLLNEKTFVCGGAVNNGGIILTWLIKNFLGKMQPVAEDYLSVFETITAVAPGSAGLIFLPYLYGERASLWDTKSCGVFFNIKPEHTQAHFLRAGLEGICFALNDVLQTLEKSSPGIRILNISGGFITSPVWKQILADITGKELIITQQEDASAIGAVFLAMEALSIQLPEKNKSTVSTMDTVPIPQHHEKYLKSFQVFRKLYRDLRETMHAVRDLE